MSAAMWPTSRVPLIDPTGTPYGGALAYFYDAGTSTPQTTYSDSGLGTSNSNPVVANASGMFGAVFLSPGSYRVRVTEAGGSLLWDDDGIAVPEASDAAPPDAGSTDPSLLFSTGMIVARHGKDPLTGWVRANGRTIGNAASGGTERANADASALFQYLWSQDTTLAVSTGRGATAAGDFAANKVISLPDYRGRTLAGLDQMGSTASGVINGVTVDNSETVDTLGATVGAPTHTLTTGQMPSHSHTATVTDPGHTHSGVPVGKNGPIGTGTLFADGGTPAGSTNSATTGISVSNASQGGGGAHPNMQPSALITFYLKL